MALLVLNSLKEAVNYYNGKDTYIFPPDVELLFEISDKFVNIVGQNIKASSIKCNDLSCECLDCPEVDAIKIKSNSIYCTNLKASKVSANLVKAKNRVVVWGIDVMTLEARIFAASNVKADVVQVFESFDIRGSIIARVLRGPFIDDAYTPKKKGTDENGSHEENQLDGDI